MSLIIKAPQMWLVSRPIDFRYSIDGLANIIINELGCKPTDGIFVFINKKRNRIKLLLWHHNGFALIYKRLELGNFTLPANGDNAMVLDDKQLSWLLAGLDWYLMSNFKELRYDDYC
jgi:transposase